MTESLSVGLDLPKLGAVWGRRRHCASQGNLSRAEAGQVRMFKVRGRKWCGGGADEAQSPQSRRKEDGGRDFLKALGWGGRGPTLAGRG